jgi:hypothetical protein
MATNAPAGDGHRNGAVRDRSQVFNPVTQQWVKRDAETGRFMDVKKDGEPFKGVRKEQVTRHSPSRRSSMSRFSQTPEPDSGPIRLIEIVANEVGTPRNNGTPGSALYRVPIRLSRSPSAEWSRCFVETWDNPPSFSTMH